MSAVAAAERIGIELPAVQRFSLADLSRHGAWLLPRLVTALELPEQRIAGWLRSLLESREHLFLTLPHSVALAELQMANGLASKPIVRERFVMVEDIDDAAQIEEAAAFYDEFKRWAKNLGAQVITISDLSNVPEKLIEAKLGRIHVRQEQFVRI